MGVIYVIYLHMTSAYIIFTLESFPQYPYMEVLFETYLPWSPIWKYVYLGVLSEICLPGSPIYKICIPGSHIYKISTRESYL